MASFAEKMFDRLLQTERMPQADARALQDSALARIVGHARATVPFYRERLAGVVRGDEVDRDAWLAVLPLTRADIGARFDDLQSSADMAPFGEVRKFESSGSTGRPIVIRTTEYRRRVNLAVNGRMFRWMDVDARLPLIVIKGNRHPALDYGEIIPDKWVPDWMVGETHGGYARLPYPIAPREQIDRLVAFGPCYLNTQPSNLRLLFSAVAAGAPVPPIRAIMTVGELVRPEDRIAAADILRSRLVDHYSSTEGGVIASECAHGRMHVHAEFNRVEVLRADGTPCAAGEDGRIVLTTLANHVMPLIRYDTGDIGAMEDGACGCGRTLPVLTMTVGRERRAFHFSDGSAQVPLFVMEKHADIFPVTEWQMRQTAVDRLELRFASDSPDSGLDRAALQDRVRAYFGPKAELDFRRFDTVPRTASGKLEPFMRDF